MLSSLLGRLQPVLRELVKFLVVGGFCFVLDIVLAYLLFEKVGLGPTTSKALATVVATGVSYLGNRLWSFSHRVEDDRGHGQDLTTYAGINVVGLVITLVPVDVAHYLLDETSALAFTVSGVIGTVFATGFRFWAYRRWGFVHDPARAQKAALV